MLSYLVVVGIYEVVSTILFLLALKYSGTLRYAMRDLLARLEDEDELDMQEEEEFFEEEDEYLDEELEQRKEEEELL